MPEQLGLFPELERRQPCRIAVMASGGGSNLQALLNANADGRLHAPVGLVIANRSDAGALMRAESAGVAHVHLSEQNAGSPEVFASSLIELLSQNEITHVVLAGYLKRMPSAVIEHMGGRVLNIHPSLLPSFGGPGLYGRRVHEAAIAFGACVSGVTVHWVDDTYDHGRPILQRACPVEPEDTPETLAGRVLRLEHDTLWRVLEAVAVGDIWAPPDRMQLPPHADWVIW